MEKYKYDVALSFAGENRSFAKNICVALKQENIEVFYDEDVDLWGKDLPTELKDVYYKDSRYCIIILSDSYVDKEWPRLELQHAIGRLVKQKGKEYILPVRLDGFSDEIPELPVDIVYINADSTNPRKVVDKFLQKIRGPHQSQKRDKKVLHNAWQDKPKKLPPVLQEHEQEETSRMLSHCGSLGIMDDIIRQQEETSRMLSHCGSLGIMDDIIRQQEEISRMLSHCGSLGIIDDIIRQQEEISKRFL